MEGKLVLPLSLLCACFFLWAAPTNGFNVTQALENAPEFSTLSTLLTQSGLADQINSRGTITLLAPPNSVLDPTLSQLRSQLTPQIAFYILSLHILMDYFDLAKLGALPGTNTSASSLYQTTGPAEALDGFVKLANLRNGRIVAGPASPPNGPFTVNVTRDVYKEPSNFSILEIDNVLVPPGILSSNGSNGPSRAPAAVNVTQLIVEAGNFSTFLALAGELGVLPELQNRTVAPGETLFIPTDAAFAALPPGALDPLSTEQKTQILAYHVVPGFYSTETLGSLEGQVIRTLATSIADGFTFMIDRNGAALTISTGVNMATVGGSFFAKNPVSLFSIDTVLLPSPIFGGLMLQPPSMAPTGPPSVQGSRGDGAPVMSPTGASTGEPMAPEVTAKATSLSCLGGGAMLALAAYLF